MLTFDQFLASRTECANLGAVLDDASLMGRPGFLYLDALYIEHIPTGNMTPDEFMLVIGNQQYVNADIEVLEPKLYDFAVSEGYTDEAGDAIAQRIADMQEAVEKLTEMGDSKLHSLRWESVTVPA